MKLWLVRWPGYDTACTLVAAEDEKELKDVLREVGDPEGCTWKPYDGPVLVPFEAEVLTQQLVMSPFDCIQPTLRNLWDVPTGQKMLTNIGNFAWPKGTAVLLAAMRTDADVACKQLSAALSDDDRATCVPSIPPPNNKT